MLSTMLKRTAIIAALSQPLLAYTNSTSDDAVRGCLCCQALAQTSLEVAFPNQTTYEARIDHIWSVDAALPPSCFVLPTSIEDASLILQLFSQYQCPFGIVSGGHADFPGGNSIEAGVTVDFGYMNKTTYDAELKVATIQPGSTWQAVYEVLTPLGVTVAGGRSGGVGVGGFTTGGGNSFFSTSHGWACDNIRSFEIVLANGTVVNASIDENNDLWQAQKGGSGNFGLVTKFDMYAIEFPDPAVPNVWGGIAYYDLNATDEVIDAYVNYVEVNYEDHNSSTMLYWVYEYAANEMLLQVAMDNTLNVEYPPIYDRYLNISGMTSNSLRSGVITNITAEFDAGQPSGLSNIWITGSYANDPRVIKFASEKHTELIAGELASIVSEDSQLVSLCSFFPLTQAMIEHGDQRGGNAIGLDEISQGKNGSIFLASLALNGDANYAKAVPIVERFVAEVDEYADSLDLNWGWRFLNYAYGYQDPTATYGPLGQEKIKAASAKYDPAQVFQKLRKTGHKVAY